MRGKRRLNVVASVPLNFKVTIYEKEVLNWYWAKSGTTTTDRLRELIAPDLESAFSDLESIESQNEDVARLKKYAAYLKEQGV